MPDHRAGNSPDLESGRYAGNSPDLVPGPGHMPRPLDQINARGLQFNACHGCLPEEKSRPQPFIVNAILCLDLSEAIVTDDLACTIDYGQVHRIIAHIMEGPPVNLLESLAGRIARDLLQAFPRLQAVEVEVQKPEAPVPGQFEHFSVRVQRTQKK